MCHVRQALRLILLIVILISVMVSLALSAQTVSDSRLKRVELTYVRTNVGAGVYTNVRIFIGVPQSLPEQTIYSIVWSPEPTSIVVDDYNQAIADFQVGTVSPGDTVAIHMVVVGIFSKIKWDINPSLVGELDDTPADIMALYTTDGDYYHITDPLIVDTSASIIGKERNPYKMAVLIHGHAVEILHQSRS